MRSILGERSDNQFTLPPDRIQHGFRAPPLDHRSQSLNVDDRDPVEGALVAEGIHRDVVFKIDPMRPSINNSNTPMTAQSGRTKANSDSPALSTQTSTESDELLKQLESVEDRTISDQQRLPPFRSQAKHAYTTDESRRKGQAHDPLEDHLYLYIGPSTYAGPSSHHEHDDRFTSDDEVPVVSESPGAADMDIYETAYRDEIERILARAAEQDKEPQVYLTRRVDAKLLAMSGRAGRWMAVGEEAKNQLKDYTQFSARKARVTVVSRALREAAREEYEKRKQERRALIEAAKAEKSREPEGDVSPTTANTNVTAPSGQAVSPEPQERLQSPRVAWKGKAVDRGKHAATSLMGFMDMVKQKGKPKTKDEET